MKDDMVYGIEIGRWTGIFSLVYYADVFIDGRTQGYHTFNAFTKKGALKKAQRYIRRINHQNDGIEIYSYDALTENLSRIS